MFAKAEQSYKIKMLIVVLLCGTCSIAQTSKCVRLLVSNLSALY